MEFFRQLPVPINIEDEMKKSYLDYAMSVIIGRALPDVRDGLKPVHRRVLFAMHDLGNAWNKSYKKSARVVGDVIGKYHPHGDTAVYDTIVRLAQDFSLRYPLVDGQGNFGSVDGDAPAAMRYTEVRMAKLSSEILADIDKDTVDFVANYDESLREPVVLPARFPNLMINGSSGIAVGMATNIPPHNLREVVDGLVAFIRNPGMTVDQLMVHIPGPDFPTGGTINGREGIISAYKTGRGIIRLRARAHVETQKKNNRESIIVTEIPYQVNKARLLEKVAQLIRQKKFEGISDIRDESDRQGMRVVFELKRDAQAQVVLNQLYKHTQMQVSFGIILLAIVNRQPITLTLKTMLAHFVDHRKEVIRRRTSFELKKAQERQHILAGLKIALEHLDEIIALIRKAKAPVEAREQLIEQFQFSSRQAQAILDMKLQRLTGLERQKILDEYAETVALIERLEAILASEQLVLDIIVDELLEIRKSYGDERRSEIVDQIGDLNVEDLIVEEDMVITISRHGYVKRTPISIYRSYHRGAGGRLGMETKEGDFVNQMFVSSTHDQMLFFTNQGRAFRLKTYEIPESGPAARGKALVNLLKLEKEEQVTTVLSTREFQEDCHVMMATRSGYVKKLEMSALDHIRSNGIRCITLEEGDSMIAAKVCKADEEIFVGTNHGQAIRFAASQVRSMGRLARGVIGCRMNEDDFVVSMEVFGHNGGSVLTVTENGFGKRTSIEDYPLRSRGGKGVITIKTTERNGKVVGVMKVVDADQIMMITDAGKITRTRVAEISVIGRNTQGVTLFRIDPSQEKLVAVATLAEGSSSEPQSEPDEQPTEAPSAADDQPRIIDVVAGDEQDSGDDDV
ncbi:MAG: DNA gyrase subunit A [Deltaproteobacteria bacterium]|nr:DNA gyrase subunit A [Candidatus Anaeroferrophillus wilburensis]MBN2888114.1 DNA gyrase subunit A [Deltaproteobacteria bacterium]